MEAFCHLHCAATQRNVGEDVWIWVLNLILCSPRLGSLQRQLFSPYGGDSAPPSPLSNDAFLTDTPERALDSGWKVNTTQCLLGCRGKKTGDPPLTKPPCATVYLYALSSDTPHRDVHKPNIFCHPWGCSSSNQNYASVVVDVPVSNRGRSECSQGTTLMVAVLASSFLLPL